MVAKRANGMQVSGVFAFNSAGDADNSACARPDPDARSLAGCDQSCRHRLVKAKFARYDDVWNTYGPETLRLQV
jgi:hypothetical protein